MFGWYGRIHIGVVPEPERADRLVNCFIFFIVPVKFIALS